MSYMNFMHFFSLFLKIGCTIIILDYAGRRGSSTIAPNFQDGPFFLFCLRAYVIIHYMYAGKLFRTQ